ncbi:NAD(P)/FAD-dependent oxidoreductase [Oscillatoria sp. CS-180]|uniref:NAD(P)/FAD-dependent oxidoreductase n=1 Tax=Oscillatoria sp. CS-180 TaxID=3021720 RepID=UPI00232E3DF1|nr:NAD(P)/FAD-dependent oxidoreductase [Oscillatoria sp. CS-180]MDB9526355.1 NAD(P)/FAD-dependent oxidoreductase [Oscillatoria sp. CS-180]
MTDSVRRICILGGGFGGLYTALRLNSLPWSSHEPVEIVLIDQRDRFIFAPLLYELVTGELATWEVAPPYAELLVGTQIQFVQSSVESIDLAGKQIQLGIGETLAYDRLVLALGGETPMNMAPGAAEHAIPFRTVEDAHKLQDQLRQLELSDAEKIRVAVVGGGYSGVELACKVADRLGDRGRVRLIERADDILLSSAEFNRQAARDALSERNVWLDLETSVETITADSMTLTYREQTDELPVDVILWTVGTRVVPLLESLDLPRNDRQQIKVDTTLQVVDCPDIFALGDLADCKDASGQQVPNTAQSALQQADYVGWNIWASLTNRPLLPFHYQHLGEMMTLGIDNATLTGLGLRLEGPLAHVARRLTYLYRMPTVNHQIRVGLNWIQQPLRDLLSV